MNTERDLEAWILELQDRGFGPEPVRIPAPSHTMNRPPDYIDDKGNGVWIFNPLETTQEKP